ncbi:MAG: DNA polymerase III subunit gamma/tau [bacterium]|nr:DNA polymerase III subunit gamma/tau [bacterium]
MGKALYRTYRPQTFADVVGQERVTKTLQEALKRGLIGHAYLFSGPRGTGKTTVARLVARAVNCDGVREGTLVTGEPCNTCEACIRAIGAKELDLIEIDAASNRGVDEIRELRERVRFAPSAGRKKVYLIDEVHMLTKEAFNALLKTLEEPPEHALFILATTEAHAIPATIISRVQHFTFRALSTTALQQTLKHVATAEQLTIEDEALDLIVALAEGGARDALSLLDVVSAATSKNITARAVRTVLAIPPQHRYEHWARALADGDVERMLEGLHNSYREGSDLTQLARGLVRYMRLVLLAQINTDVMTESAAYLTAEQRAQVAELGRAISQTVVVQAVRLLNQAALEMRTTSVALLPLEVASIQLCALVPKSTPARHAVPEPVVRPPEPVVRPKKVNKETTAATSQPQSVQLQSAPAVELEPVDESFVQTLIAGWSEALAHVRQKNIGIGSLLKSAVLLKVDGAKAWFVVEYAFHRDRIMSINNRRLIEEILEQRFNKKIMLACVLQSELSEQDKKMYSQRKQAMLNRTQAGEEQPLTDLALSLLGGQVVD